MQHNPNKARSVFILAMAVVAVICVAAIAVAGMLAGPIGAAYMTFGVVLMVVLSAIAVWFRIYYERARPPQIGRQYPPRQSASNGDSGH